ncbi:MAG: hypothetical protein H0T42_22375 [Deltaproteobacteria bacterium]|nr:hypothetical protein [Deltaproteobacteria bacterium]
MSEYASRERGFDGGFAPRTYAETPAPAPRSEAEQAGDRVARLARDVAALERAITAVQQATAANDPKRWQEAKQGLERQVAATHQAHQRARALAIDAKPETHAQLATAEEALVEHERLASTLTEPPRGWDPVSHETEILAIITEPIQGSARDGWARKMAALKAELAQLSAAESRVLGVRLKKQEPNDALALALAPGVRINQERFNDLIAFLDGARRREAIHAARHPKPTVQQPTTPPVADRDATATANIAPFVPGPSTNTAGPAKPQPMDVLRLAPESETTVAPHATSQHDANEREVPREATRLYLQTNSNSVWGAVRSHLDQTSWPAATDQFTWRQPHAFADAVVNAVHDTVMTGAKAGDINLSQLDSLLYPLRVHDEIAGLLPILTQDDRQEFAPSKHWLPAIGLRIGQLVQSALVPSVVRMSQRFIDATNVRAEQAKHESLQIEAKDLITSSPLDRIVARALVAPGSAEVVPNGSVNPKGRTSLRPVTLTWEGERDPKLWSWVRADLADATVEEVAASLYGYARDQAGDATSYYAYGIASAAPMFGLPASWAVQFPEARAHAPAGVKQGTMPDDKTDSIATRLSGLAATDAADAIALQQAAGTPIVNAEPTAVLAAVDDTLIQLGALRSVLAPWGLASEILPVLLHAVSKRDTLRTAPPHDVQAYAAVAFGQRDRLGRIAGSVAAALGAANKLSASRDDNNPIQPILARYAQAAASAQLATTCEELIAGAQDMQRALVIKALQANRLASMQAMEELHAGPAMKDHPAPKDKRTALEIATNVPAESHVPRSSSRGARDLSRPYLDVQDRARVLENTLLQGGEVDPDELQRVQLESQEIALRARLDNLMAHLEVIDGEADKAGAGLGAKLASLGSSRFRGLRDASQTIRSELVLVRRDLILDQKMPKPRSGDGDGLTPPPLEISAKCDALANAQARFGAISEDRELGTFLKNAYDVIESQRLRTAVVTAAAMIGLSFVGSGMASVLTKGIGRAFGTVQGIKEIADLSLKARAGIFAVGVATETIVNSAAQVAFTGDDPWKALVENALMTVGMEGTSGVIAKDVGVARAFHKQLAEQAAQLQVIEANALKQSSKLGKAARVVGREVLAISGHTVMGMALGALSGRILAALDGKQAHAPGAVGWEDTVIQGASVAIGRLAHARVAERRQSLDELARHSGSADAQRLVEHARQLEALSAAVIKAPDAQKALDVLAHQERLIQQEIRVIEELLARPDHGGYSADDLTRSKAELSSQLGNAGDATMLSVKLHLTGLRELAPGTLWSGTPDDIARGVREIQATRPDATVQQELSTTTVRVGDHVFEFHEVAGPAQQRPSADHANTRPPEATHELSNTVVRVPGSEMRGGTQGVEKSAPHTAALLERAKATAGTAQLPGVTDIRSSSKPGTYLVMLSDLSWTSVEVTVARTDGSNPAHLVPNSARITKIDGIQIRGEHVLQVSERLPVEQVDRVVAHGLARLVDAHRQAVRGTYAGNDDSVLSPDDRGRIAEISVLARAAASGNPAASARARAELAMLTEYLGIRDGAPMANERRSAIDGELKGSTEVRAELARAFREPLSEAQRKSAFGDLAAEQADHQHRTAPHDAPPTMTTQPGQRVTREQIAQYADVAARLRHLVSQRTLARFRAQHAQHPGQHPRIEGVQLGAGAALAGRDPSKLLVDARGRWQADGSENIAQVGQQLQDLYRARFGDVREVAGPGERISLDAIRYWEDSLAAQGDVIDGYGALRTENGKLLLDIKPTDGSAPLTLEIGGTVTSAPGFPSENIPGGARNVSAGEAILSIERALRALDETDGPHRDAAIKALARMQDIKTTRDVELARVADVLRDASPEFLTALRTTETPAPSAAPPGPTTPARTTAAPDRIPVDTALLAATGGKRWDALMNKDAADGERQLFFSKEANDETIKKAARERDDVKRTWIFAGAGGNAVSGAEIILASTQNANVTLVAQNQPAGLFENGQFRSMAEHHGDAQVAGYAKAAGVIVDLSRSTKRLHLVLDSNLDFATPELTTGSDGSQRVELRNKVAGGAPVPVVHAGQTITGDMFVSALGSPGQLPPEIGALALEARRRAPVDDDANPVAEQRSVWIEADLAKGDERYLGYTVHIRIGGGYRSFEVRGAASRFVPREEFKRMGARGEKDLARIDQAWVDDAHPKSGNFAAGMAPTTVQGSQQHVEKARSQ